MFEAEDHGKIKMGAHVENGREHGFDESKIVSPEKRESSFQVGFYIITLVAEEIGIGAGLAFEMAFPELVAGLRRYEVDAVLPAFRKPGRSNADVQAGFMIIANRQWKDRGYSSCLFCQNKRCC